MRNYGPQNERHQGRCCKFIKEERAQLDPDSPDYLASVLEYYCPKFDQANATPRQVARKVAHLERIRELEALASPNIK
jgi:hypothetical protein